jgi:magnesium transporter
MCTCELAYLWFAAKNSPFRSVNPTYFVTFSTSVIIASTILFQGFNTSNTTTTVTLLLGFVVTFVGVHLLNISRIPDPPPLSAENIPLSSHAFETGIMNPRLSISGRISQDGWPLSAGGAFNGGHSRRGSINSIFNPMERQHSLAFSEDEAALRLGRLREEDEEEDADETTRLTGRNQVDRIPSPDKPQRAEPAPRIEAEG